MKSLSVLAALGLISSFIVPGDEVLAGSLSATGVVKYKKDDSSERRAANTTTAAAYLKDSWVTYQNIAIEVAEIQLRAINAAKVAEGTEVAKAIPGIGAYVTAYKFQEKATKLGEELLQGDILGVSEILAKETGILAAKALGPAPKFVAVVADAYLKSIGEELGAEIGRRVYE